MEDQKQPEHDHNRKGPISSGIAPGPGEHFAADLPTASVAGNRAEASAGPATPGGQTAREWRWPKGEAMSAERGGYGGSESAGRTLLESAGTRIRRSRGTYVAGAVVAGFLLQRILQSAPARRSARRDMTKTGGADASLDADREYGLDTAYAPEPTGATAGSTARSAAAITDRLRQAGGTAKSRLQATTEDAKARLRSMGDLTRDQYYRARDRVGATSQEKPLLIGAIGVALGAGLGAMLAATRRENELLGDMRDKVMAKAKETASSKMQTVKDSAQRFAEFTKQETERMKNEALPGSGQTGSKPADVGATSASSDARQGMR